MTTSLAFVFPGQGSQSLGMLSELYAEHAIVRDTLTEANTALGYDLWEIISHDQERLNQTQYTQPALLAVSVALWRLWLQQGGAKPDVMAGHSLGEYSALVAANSLTLSDAVKLVSLRGQLMQAAVPLGTGAMAAIIGLDDVGVKALCEACAAGEVLTPANFNSLGQVVIAGNKTAVERAVTAAKEYGAKLAKLLPVSVPSHCALMQPASEQLARALADMVINAPEIPVINNVDVVKANTPDDIRTALVKQLYSPVRWVETVQALQNLGIQKIIECGPGKVLMGLNKRIVQDIPTLPLFDKTTLSTAQEQLGVQ